MGNDPFETSGNIGINKVVLLSVILIIAILVIVAIKPMPTSYIVFAQESYTFDFSDSSKYTHDSSLINFTSGAVSLSLQTNTTTTSTTNFFDASLSAATYNSEDVISNLNAIDDEKQVVKSNKAFEITFSNSLNNSDVIGFYMATSTDSGTIYVCAQNTDCNSPGFGSVSYDKSAGWFNITLSGMSQTASSFRIKTTEKFKFDYIKATYAQTTTIATATTSYPSSASVETSDIIVSNLSKWKTFSANENLNGQTINYAYSTNSGSSWTSVTSGADLSNIDASSKNIRFKATLNSDNISTPIINSISIGFETSYTPPCAESWTCTEWGSCSENWAQTRTCTDLNLCGTINSKPSTMQGCTYIPSTVTIGNETTAPLVSVEANRTILFNASAAYGTDIEFFSKTTYINKSLDVAKYESVSVPSNVSGATAMSSFREINASNELKKDIGWAIIKIYYTDAELAAKKLKEDTLKIYFYNETTSSWAALGSVVNKTGKYVYANVSHFSLYGVFGEQIQETPVPALPSGGSSDTGGISGGGSGGASSAATIVREKPTEKPTEIKQPPATIPPKKEIIEAPKTVSTPTAKQIKATDQNAKALTSYAIAVSNFSTIFTIICIAIMLLFYALLRYGKILKK